MRHSHNLLLQTVKSGFILQKVAFISSFKIVTSSLGVICSDLLLLDHDGKVGELMLSATLLPGILESSKKNCIWWLQLLSKAFSHKQKWGLLSCLSSDHLYTLCRVATHSKKFLNLMAISRPRKYWKVLRFTLDGTRNFCSYCHRDVADICSTSCVCFLLVYWLVISLLFVI